MIFSLTRSVSQTDLAIPLSEVKEHIRYDGTDEDELIKRMIREATEEAGVACDTVFGTATCVFTCDGFPNGEFNLGVRPITTFNGIQYVNLDGDLVTLDPDTYSVGMRTGRLAPRTTGPYSSAAGTGGWPTDAKGGLESIVINFTAGLSLNALPFQARSAIKMIVASRFEKRGDTDEIRDEGIPKAVQRMLFQLKTKGLF